MVVKIKFKILLLFTVVSLILAGRECRSFAGGLGWLELTLLKSDFLKAKPLTASLSHVPPTVST